MSQNLNIENEKVVIDVNQRFKEGKGLEGLDLAKVELISGDTPKDIKERCLNLCNEYLSGNWTQQTTDTIEVRRITGGLLNQIYFCGICQPNNTESVPQEVAIKLYGKPFSNNERDRPKIKLSQLVITTIFSQLNLGPKIYGIFDQGQIIKFYKQRPFHGEKEKDPQLIQKVFRSLARIHSLEIPIEKSGNKWMQSLEKSYQEVEEEFNRLVEEHNCETLKRHNFKTEINWFKDVIKRLKSPVVFCHSDYRSSNLMITEPNDELIICDFDLSSYNYRGSDFSFMMMEWNKRHFLESLTNIDGLPLGDQMKPFIDIYVDECQQIYGKCFTENPNNSVEHILRETKVFLLFQYLFHISFDLRGIAKDIRLKQDNIGKNMSPPIDPKLRMEKAENNYKNYISIKKILEEKYTFVQ